MTEVTHSYSSCGPLVPGDLGLKAILCSSPDGTKGEISFLPIVGWVTLTEIEAGTPERSTWTWQPVVVFEHDRPADFEATLRGSLVFLQRQLA